MNDAVDIRDISAEDILIAREVATGQVKDTGSMRTFNKTYKALASYISRRYSIAGDGDRHISSSNNPSFQISIEEKDPSDTESHTVDISIGEFIFDSLSKWNPERSSYLTYINRYFTEWGIRSPYKADSALYRKKEKMKRNLQRIINEKTGKPINTDEVEKYIAEKPEFLPKKYIDEYQTLLMGELSLDTIISSENTDSGSTLLDLMGSIESSADTFHNFENFETLLETCYRAFSASQARTKPALSVYLTVEVYKVLYLQPDRSEWNTLTERYPDMLNHDLVPWITDIVDKNINDYSEKPNDDKRFPSTEQQAEKAGKEWHAYLNLIRRFKNCIRSEKKDNSAENPGHRRA